MFRLKLLIIPEGEKFANLNIELGLSFTTLQPIKYQNIPAFGKITTSSKPQRICFDSIHNMKN